MSNRVGPTKGEVWEDSGCTLMARIRNSTTGGYITVAGLTAIDYKVFDTYSATPDVATQTGTLIVSNVVFDTLQTGDPRWAAAGGDSVGFNFAHGAPAAWFPDANRVLKIEYKFTPTSGEQFFVVFQVTTKEVKSS